MAGTVQVGSLRSTAFNTASGEFALDDISAASKAAGWALDVQKVNLGAGDKKPVTVRYGHAWAENWRINQSLINLKQASKQMRKQASKQANKQASNQSLRVTRNL